MKPAAFLEHPPNALPNDAGSPALEHTACLGTIATCGYDSVTDPSVEPMSKATADDSIGPRRGRDESRDAMDFLF